LVRDFFPSVATVLGAEHAAARPAARDIPEIAPRLPYGREQDARVVAVHRDLDSPGDVAAIKHLLPGLAAVLGAEHTALLVGAEHVAQCRDIDEVGIGR